MPERVTEMTSSKGGTYMYLHVGEMAKVACEYVVGMIGKIDLHLRRSHRAKK